MSMRKTAIDMDAVSIMKFVYDFDSGDYETDGPTHYYDHPYHSQLKELMYERFRPTGDEDDFYDHEAVEAYLLLEDGPNALDYSELDAMTVACRSDPIDAIIAEFDSQGYKPLAWYNSRTKELTDLGSGTVAKVSEQLTMDLDYEEEEVCDECGEPGHESDAHCDECGSLEHDEGEHCERCGELGHSADEHCDYCDEAGHDEYDCPQREEDEMDKLDDYDSAMTMKFVYDREHDEFVTGDEPQTYYDRPHHSDYMETLAETTGNWEFDEIDSGYLFLVESKDNAIDGVAVEAMTIVTTIPLHQGIVDQFTRQGYRPLYWHHAYNGTERIPAAAPRPRITRRIAVVPNFL